MNTKKILYSVFLLASFYSCKKSEIRDNIPSSSKNEQEEILHLRDIKDEFNGPLTAIKPGTKIISLKGDTTTFYPFTKKTRPEGTSLKVGVPDLEVLSHTGSTYTMRVTANFASDDTYTYFFINSSTGAWFPIGETYSSVITFTTTLQCMDEYYVHVNGWHWNEFLQAFVEFGAPSETSVYHVAPYISVAGMGNDEQGADFVISDINNNGIKDIVFMSYDNPSGANTFRYKIAYDVNANGQSSNISGTKIISGVSNEAHGAGMAIEDIDGNGTKDLVLMAYDNPPGANYFKYKVGYNINSSGDVSSWSAMTSVIGPGNEGQGAKIAFKDIDNNGQKDIILMAHDNPTGANSFKYKIGYNINAAGQASSWSSIVSIVSLSNEAAGAGMEILDVNGNGILDIVLMSYDDAPGYNTFRYKIGYDINAAGAPTTISDQRLIAGAGDIAQDASLRIADIDNNGTNDLLLMHNDNPSGANSFRYFVSKNLTSNGLYSTFICN